MIDTIWIDGVAYHAQPKYADGDIEKDANGEYVWELILDPVDEMPIPKTSCICAAHSDDECICGAWSGAYDSEEY